MTKSFKNYSGATLIEMSMIFLLFLSIVFAIFYLGFHSITKSLVDAGIGKALDRAAVHPGFNDDPPTGCTGKTNRECCQLSENISKEWCIALAEVEQKALEIPQSSLLKDTPGSFAYVLADPNPVEVTLPLPKGTESLNMAYKETPIEVKLTYNVLNILGSYDTITRTGYIFRESPNSAAYNVTTDCHGNPEHSPLYNKQPCVCDTAAGFGSVTQGGVAECRLCSSLTPLASPTASQVTSRITGLPITTHGGTNFYRHTPITSSTCMCPSHDYCAHVYGPGSYLYGGSDTLCRCWCHPSFGTVVTGDGFNKPCACKDTVPGAYPANAPDPDYPAVTFNPVREVTKYGGLTVCACNLSPESQKVPAYRNTTRITTEMCRKWFTPFHGPSYDFCSCVCGIGSFSCGGSGLSSGVDPTTCECKCRAGISKIDPVTGRCVCDSDACPPGRVVELINGQCKCVLKCPGGYAEPNQEDPNAVCRCCNYNNGGGAYPNCNAAACGGGGKG